MNDAYILFESLSMKLIFATQFLPNSKGCFLFCFSLMQWSGVAVGGNFLEASVWPPL
jgi:hypothetical protein